jgi:hypothetical protein
VGVETALLYAAHDMNTKLFVVQNPGGGGDDNNNNNNGDGLEGEGWSPSKLYRFHGFLQGLRIAYMEGGMGNNMTFYLGTMEYDEEKEDTTTTTTAVVVGLVNIAAFLAQSMKETIQYDACDENNWDILDGKYPLSNACGQLGQSYQDYNCPDEYRHMQCQVDPNMELKATTQASWYGAPGPLFCGPTSVYPTTGYWDYTYTCDYSWEDPPRYCTDYVGQKGGRYDNSEAVMNRNNRTDVMGCCWWGRGCVVCYYYYLVCLFCFVYILFSIYRKKALLLCLLCVIVVEYGEGAKNSNKYDVLHPNPIALLYFLRLCIYIHRVIQTTGKDIPWFCILDIIYMIIIQDWC